MTQLQSCSYWYLRHGQTDWNRDGLSQGRTDVPLNATGIAQADAAVKLFQQSMQAGARITHIVSSPLMRAMKTATIVQEGLMAQGHAPLPLTTDAGLEEVCFGEQEGQPMGDWYDSWIAGDYTPNGAEDFADLRARAVAAVNRATAAGGVPLIVAHGALFRALRSAMNLPANVRLPNATPLWIQPPEKASVTWQLTVMGD
ncbi:histidine phosphatase family protein [Acetobacter farinalis]|uniref:Histidine phosphatase family protein n=1 Tax=Acetobacter farinalis TaxID=1260984 RepID=A0ABT3Q9Q2_9PROT|nr:histidine phosphatase family protein [Acetobacter farinalis]MCX2562009.1 histidine phosphatase family protein [Acetobacter farinalis]NHO30607.1 histidine phosphatase family protein [Acetobacter farinalis]